MKRIRQSILNKFLCVLFMCIAAVSIGTSVIASINIEKESFRSVGSGMNLVCQTDGQSLYEALDEIQQSVDYMAEMSTYLLDNPKQIIADQKQRETFTDLLQKNFAFLATKTLSDVGYWFVYDPSLIHENDGFYYAKQNAAQEEYSKREILIVDEKAKETSDWYWNAKDKGSGIWLEPYENAEDEYLITYSAPIVLQGTIIGVIGIDVDYPSIIEFVKDIRCYNEGYAYLLNEEGVLMAHPYADYRNYTRNYVQEMGIDLSGERTSGEELIRYETDGTVKYMAYRTLPNGMKLIVVDTREDIMSAKNENLRTVILYILLLSLIFLLVSIQVVYWIVAPIKQLSDATDEVIKGNLDTRIETRSIDEIGRLAHNFTLMTEKLKEHFRLMHDLAYKDALTKVNNKSAYNEKIMELNHAIQNEEAEFAVVMCDVNGLKRINDDYGHEAGDRAIRVCCKKICHIFKQSPVYRIGGDEFVAILEGEDYLNREDLMKEAEALCIHRDYTAEEPWEEVSVSAGISQYRKADTDYTDVFKRADEAMYTLKHANHLTREDDEENR